MHAHVRRRALSIVAVLALFPAFQNCGQAFVPANDSAEFSSQCKAEMKASFTADVAALNCADRTNYVCERRQFTPDVADGVSIVNFEGTEVTHRVFNTSAARLAEPNPAAFEIGGEYNREEARCHHKTLHRGIAMIEGDSETVADALERAIAACEGAGS